VDSSGYEDKVGGDMDGLEKKTFYGSTTRNVCAFCWKHKLYMTSRQVKKRKCIHRRCDAFHKLDHPYWKMREEKMKACGEKKARMEAAYAEIRLAAERRRNGVCS